MRKYIYLILAISFLIFSNNGWAGTASGTITMAFDLSAHGHGEEAQLWVPYPITNNNQTITNIQVKGNYSSSRVYTDKQFQTPMLYARWDSGTTDRQLTFTFDAQRQNSQPIKK